MWYPVLEVLPNKNHEELAIYLKLKYGADFTHTNIARLNVFRHYTTDLNIIVEQVSDDNILLSLEYKHHAITAITKASTTTGQYRIFKLEYFNYQPYGVGDQITSDVYSIGQAMAYIDKMDI
jgi:hypothetical protein